MDWKQEYEAKRVSAAEAVSRIRSGQRVYYAGNAGVPGALIRALAERRDELEGVELCHLLVLGEDPVAAPGWERSFRHNLLFVGPAHRDAVNSGRADYLPVFLHQIPRLFETALPLDVTMISVSPPDAHGYMSLGVETLASVAAVNAARTVIAQVNPRMPRVLGQAFVTVDAVDAIVEHEEPLPSLSPSEPTAVEQAIAGHVVPLIRPGDTIQMGIGGIPDSIYAALEGPMDLGIHTEMFSDGAMRAVQRGVVTGRRKSLHPEKAVVTFVLGSEELYRFVHDNPGIEARPSNYVNDPFVVAKNHNMVAINSALEVDLTGQVCSDSIGTKIYSGFGGQVDFIRGAARAPGGRPIIALPATAKRGTRSRIVSQLQRGAGVVTTRADVHYVVTEHGVANLFGRNLRERAQALIAIAAPEFREALERDAHGRGLL